MTGIVKTDQIQGAGSSTVTIPSGNVLSARGGVSSVKTRRGPGVEVGGTRYTTRHRGV